MSAPSIEPAMYSGAISVVGQPNANHATVGYPSRPSGRTPLAALTSSTVARSSGWRRLPIVDEGVEVAAHDLAGDAAGEFIEHGNLPRHFVVRQALTHVLLQSLR